MWSNASSGGEGGLDQYQDSNYTTMLIAMAQGDDPGEMTFEIIDGKIEMTLKGDMYNQYRQDDTKGVYKVDLKANQSTEIAQIPILNMRKPHNAGNFFREHLLGVYNGSSITFQVMFLDSYDNVKSKFKQKGWLSTTPF